MTIEIGMLLFPNVTQLDLTGPFEVLRSLPGARVHTLGKTTEPVQSEGGLTLVPSTSYAEAPTLDVLFVPGGAGQIPMTRDPEVLAYLHEVGSAAQWEKDVLTLWNGARYREERYAALALCAHKGAKAHQRFAALAR